MSQPINRKIILYSALFIASVINLPKLLAQARGENMSRIVPFDLKEWFLRFVISFLFCITVLYANSQSLMQYHAKVKWKDYCRTILVNLALLAAFTIIGGIVSRQFFRNTVLPLNGSFFRCMVGMFLAIVELKIIAVTHFASEKEKENKSLQLANTTMELELLKTQLNPHFLFNAFSTLAGVIHENPAKAQHYITQLANIFRYSLNKEKEGLTTVEKEIEQLRSYAELMKMRYESGFHLSIDIDTSSYSKLLPHISLQPLVENALKHNVATADSPLHVSIKNEKKFLVIENNIQQKPFPEPGAGIGLHNLQERVRILIQQEMEILRTDSEFIVKLPLK